MLSNISDIAWIALVAFAAGLLSGMILMAAIKVAGRRVR